MNPKLPLIPAAPRDPRIRYWKTGGLLAIFFLTMVIGNFCIPEDKAITRRILGLDFLAFYYGGTVARTGEFEKLYDLDATRKFEYATGHAADMELGTSFGPFWNPPFAAWMFAPLAALPFRTALLVWWGIGLACLAAAIFMMCRMLKGGWKTWALVPLFILTTMPFFQAFTHGQNTFISLFLLTLVVWLWRGGKPFLAGLACGLLLYKPQLGAVVAIVLCMSQGRRALLGVTLVGFAFAVINIVTEPGTLREFYYHMPVNLHWMQEENHYMWSRHVTFKGFWRLLFQGRAMGPTAPIVVALWGICEVALLAGLYAAVRNIVRQPPSASRTDRLIAASIVAMPLLMPFYFDYDLLLISVGIVVYAADRQRETVSSTTWEDRWLPRIWLILTVVLEFGTILAGHTRVHPVVPLVSFAAAMLIRRALRPQLPEVQSGRTPRLTSPIPIAA